MQTHRQGEFDVSRIRPRLGGLSHLERLHGKLLPRPRGLPGLADRATRHGGSPHLSCKRDQIKMRDYTDRWVTPPKRVTSPTWGPPLHLHVNRPSEGRESSCKYGDAHYLLLGDILSSLMINTILLWHGRSFTF